MLSNMIVKKKINRIPRAPKISSGIRPEGGATTNQEYLHTGEYYPDRTLVPLVLQPYLAYTDATTGKTVDNALPELIDGQWYRLTASNRHLGMCEATKISPSATGTDTNGDAITLFTISSTPGAADYGRLTVRENVPPGEEITYIFTAILSTDGRPVREFFTTRCDSVSEVPDILFDNNATALYDPLNDPRYFTLKPHLSFELPVKWRWMSYHELEGGWVELGSTPLDWCIERVGDGIRIDRSRMQDVLLLRCLADVTLEGQTVTLENVVSHTRKMPHFEVDVIRVGDLPEDVDTICPYALITYNKEPIANDTDLLIEWLNDSGQVVGTGINPTIRISSLGPSGCYSLSVTDRGGYAAIIHEGKLLVDGSGALIITRAKK